MPEDSFDTGARRMENTLRNPVLNERPSVGQKLKNMLFGTPKRRTASAVASLALATAGTYHAGYLNTAPSEAKGLGGAPHSQEYKVGFGPYYGKPISNGVALDRDGNEINNINGLTNGENRIPQKYRIQQSVPEDKQLVLYKEPNEAADHISFEDAKAVGIDVAVEMRAQPVAGAQYGEPIQENKLGNLLVDKNDEHVGQWWQVQGMNAKGEVVTVNMKSADVRLNNPNPVIEVKLSR